MSIGGNDYSWAPRHREQVRSSQFYPITYSSAAYEPDVNLSLSATSSQPTNLALGERPLFGAIRAPFEDRKITQALIDVAAVVVAFLLILVTSLSIVGSLFILFFVEI
ncbi:MAG: hypothetical protein NT113_13310 [Hyphomicrobiales bacterium]|nr:hypothetical protein [Hyphomicrobiales bacterium]